MAKPTIPTDADVQEGTDLIPKCPKCGASPLAPSDDGSDSVCCPSCGTRWHYELGYVWAIGSKHASSDADR